MLRKIKKKNKKNKNAADSNNSAAPAKAPKPSTTVVAKQNGHSKPEKKKIVDTKGKNIKKQVPATQTNQKTNGAKEQSAGNKQNKNPLGKQASKTGPAVRSTESIPAAQVYQNKQKPKNKSKKKF